MNVSAAITLNFESDVLLRPSTAREWDEIKEENAGEHRGCNESEVEFRWYSGYRILRCSKCFFSLRVLGVVKTYLDLRKFCPNVLSDQIGCFEVILWR